VLNPAGCIEVEKERAHIRAPLQHLEEGALEGGEARARGFQPLEFWGCCGETVSLQGATEKRPPRRVSSLCESACPCLFWLSEKDTDKDGRAKNRSVVLVRGTRASEAKASALLVVERYLDAAVLAAARGSVVVGDRPCLAASDGLDPRD